LDHIELMRKAIEFKNPAYIPLELVEVPGIFGNYGLRVSEEVSLIEGTQDFDALDATFCYIYEDMGEDSEGNRLRRSEWGFVEKVPIGGKYDYLTIKNPLADWGNLKSYEFPSPSVTDEFFVGMKKAFKRYPDRFKVAYIDPGPFYTALFIIGYEKLLMSLYTDLDKVKYVFDGIIHYYIEVVKRWKDIGAHMVTFTDTFAYQRGFLFSPKLWREHFKSFYKKMFDFVHGQGMYVGLGLDGETIEIVPDLKEIGMDVFDLRQPTLMGIDNLAKICGGKLCVKATIDMQTTLYTGTPHDIHLEAEELVTKLGERNGGFIAMVIRESTPGYPEENVRASVEAFNHFRKRRQRMNKPDSNFRVLDHPILGKMERKEQINIYVDGKKILAYEGEPIAASLAAARIKVFRFTSTRAEPRGIFCAIGRCTDCVMTVNGEPNVRTCVTPVEAGMKIETQKGLGRWQKKI